MHVHVDSNAEAIELAEAASLLFAEYGLGYRSERELRRELDCFSNSRQSFRCISCS